MEEEEFGASFKASLEESTSIFQVTAQESSFHLGPFQLCECVALDRSAYRATLPESISARIPIPSTSALFTPYFEY